MNTIDTAAQSTPSVWIPATIVILMFAAPFVLMFLSYLGEFVWVGDTDADMDIDDFEEN